eukprot:SAG11_NODE_22584_length_403_cov_1.187500_1_plen_30_part_10
MTGDVWVLRDTGMFLVPYEALGAELTPASS